MNSRIEEYFRDPTLDAPAENFFEVRVGRFDRILLDRREAHRVLAAFVDPQGPEVIRCQDLAGSVIYLRPREIQSVRESTRAQREARRRLWKQLDDEDENDNDY